jgi:hypothetical protein
MTESFFGLALGIHPDAHHGATNKTIYHSLYRWCHNAPLLVATFQTVVFSYRLLPDYRNSPAAPRPVEVPIIANNVAAIIESRLLDQVVPLLLHFLSVIFLPVSLHSA